MNFINLGMKNSLVIYDKKIGLFDFAENLTGYQAPNVIFLIKLKKSIQLPYGFKNNFLMN